MSLPRAREVVASATPYRTHEDRARVRLNSNEAPDAVALRAYLGDDDLEAPIARYPDVAARAVREAAARALGVAADRVLVGNGSNEILLYTFLAYGGPGRRLLVFTPTYHMYAWLGRLTGMDVRAEAVGVPYALDAARVRAAVRKHAPDLVVLCSPNNPTGTLVASDAVVAAAEAAEGACVLVDEAYGEFAGETAIGAHPAVAVARTFSKARAAAGLRLGVLVADPRVIAPVDAARLPYNVSAVAQRVALRVLADAAMEARVAGVRAERERVRAALERRDGVTVEPSAANFLLFRVRGRAAGDLHAALIANDVLVRDVSAWPDAGESLRVTIGTRDENDAFLSALDRAITRRDR